MIISEKPVASYENIKNSKGEIVCKPSMFAESVFLLDGRQFRLTNRNYLKPIMGEIKMPAGEVYSCVEGANGELGFYFISDGGRTPYRLHFRRPCFIYYQAYSELTKGGMLSDAIITMSSLNLIAGELDA